MITGVVLNMKGFALFASLICCHCVLVDSQMHDRPIVPGDDAKLWSEVDKARGLQNEAVLRQLVRDTALGQHGVTLNPTAILSSDKLASRNVSLRCFNDTYTYLMDIISGKPYAIKMFDSVAKPPAGIMEGNFNWIGSSGECRSVKSQDYINGPGFNGKYCQANFPLAALSKTLSTITLVYGVCVPDTCNDFDVFAVMDLGITLLPVQGLNASTVVCTEDQSISKGAIVMFVITGILLSLMIIGTVYQLVIHFIYQAKDKDALPVSLQRDVREDEENLILTSSNTNSFQYQPGIFGQCILAFSVLANGRKILDTRHASGTLAAVHGIRVLSMWWVILGHSYGFTFQLADNMLVMPDILKRFTFQAISNATFSVDTFFFLSGLLVTYLTLRELREGRNINWVIFYLHRFWRLTPMYMFMVFFSTYVVPLFGSGAFKASLTSVEDPCVKYWWTNLLYINNLVPWPAETQCFPVAWYLANDMQFHIISPLVIILLYRWPKIGYGVLGILLSGCLAVRAGLGVHYDLTSSINQLISPASNATYFISSPYYYTKPWTRISTYIIGMIVGHLLVVTSCRVKINKVINFICWLAAWAIALAVLYGLYGTFHGVVLSRPVDILYMTVCQVAWGVAIGWLTFACLTGNGGPINTILAWKAWIPISRLTYAAYLTHLEVILVYMVYRDRLLHVTDLEEIYLFIGALVISYCVSFVLSLMTEAPMMKLEKILLRKGKRA